VLQSLPVGPIHPEGFVEGGTALMNHLILRMTRKVFKHQVHTEEDWRHFRASAPISDDVSQYLDGREFHIPLHNALLNGLPIDLTAPSVKTKTRDKCIIHAKDTVMRKNNENSQIASSVLAGLKGTRKPRGKRKSKEAGEDGETGDINEKAPVKRKSRARANPTNKLRRKNVDSSGEEDESSDHEDERFIGRRCTVPVRHHDGTEESWHGSIISFDSKVGYYKVRYDDNSEEEFSENEILQIVNDSAAEI
jgi:hypothetical protein